MTEHEIKGPGQLHFFFLEKPLHEIFFIQIGCDENKKKENKLKIHALVDCVTETARNKYD
jgi:hypothetical protein